MGLFLQGDEIFHKSYKWIKPRLVDVDEDVLSNDDDFFSGLP